MTTKERLETKKWTILYDQRLMIKDPYEDFACTLMKTFLPDWISTNYDEIYGGTYDGPDPMSRDITQWGKFVRNGQVTRRMQWAMRKTQNFHIYFEHVITDHQGSALYIQLIHKGMSQEDFDKIGRIMEGVISTFATYAEAFTK